MEGCNLISSYSRPHMNIIIFLLVACATAHSYVNASTNETDLSALLSFKSLITGDPFQVLFSWNNSFHYCEWQGIMCGRRRPNRVTGLVLDSKQLSGQITPSLANLTFLRTLSLSDNQLFGSIPQEFGRLCRMRFLNLSANSLDGMIPQTFYNCSYLSFLCLNDNKLQGTIPSDLAQCRNLQIIGLRNNLLVGRIPPELGSLRKLYKLELYKNNFIGNIPNTLSNLTKLLELNLSHNSLRGKIPSSLGQLRSLQILHLAFNKLSSNIPNSIYNMSAMVLLSLASNQLQGTLPSNMCDSFPNLQLLLIYKTQLRGRIPTSISNCSALTAIEFDYNNLTGTIPSTIGILDYLRFFKVNNNQLVANTQRDWNFIDAMINCTALQHLELGANRLGGIMPNSIANLSSNLEFMGLYSNPFFGKIPAEIGKLTNLITLELDQTYLTGTIPKEIGNLWKLQKLNLDYTLMSGIIPSTIGNLTRMDEIYLYNNSFEGSIPVALSNMKNLEVVNFGSNKLTGSIPKEITNLFTLIGIDFSSNYLHGSLPPEISKLKNLVSIYLSDNKLSGQIPNTIYGCQLLQFLYLDGNSFEGIIPSSLSNMRGLQVLNLSNNSFNGQVPEFLGKMNLQYLDISFNNFEGELPTEGVFKNASELDVRGNTKLCGGVPELHLPKCASGSPRERNHHTKIMTIVLSICSGCLFLAVVLYILAHQYLRKRSQNNKQSIIVMKSQYKNVSFNNLFRATKGFSSENIVGRGSFGVVYKANMVFEDVRTVAVKVLNLDQHGAFSSFLAECEVLRYIRHRNLVKVLSLCSSIDHQGNDFKALIFEFMPNGNLEAWLHPSACLNRPFKSLNIVQRLNIALDVAVALDYLHSHGTVPIVHCDLKPGNVLLDYKMTAHVGDFGLSRLVQPESMPPQSTTSTSRIKGSIGYIPPEYGMGSQISVQGDVYSYGILLLEMFTGVSPTDERLRDGFSLHRHVEMAFPDHVMDIIDSKLFSESHGAADNLYVPNNIDNCLVSVLQCALQCSKESPKERIAMTDVIRELNSACAKLLI